MSPVVSTGVLKNFTKFLHLLCVTLLPSEQALTINRFDSLVIILLVFVGAHSNETLAEFLTSA